MKQQKRFVTGVRLTATQRERADAFARATGAARAGVLARAIDLGLEQLARQVRVDEER